MFYTTSLHHNSIDHDLRKNNMPGIIIIFFSTVGFLLFGLSIFPALHAKSWKRFFLSMILSAVGIIFPLFIFITSMFLVPDWKGGCRYGWIDCFHIGKLALTPLVLWACAAFYVVQILKPKPKPRAWVDLGLFIGAVISTVCLIFGVILHSSRNELTWWLLVPLYVSIWYCFLFIRTFRGSGLNPIAYLMTLALSGPFWIMSVIWSKKNYLSLPDNPPDCFVVTAALRGHESIVGPISEFERHGTYRRANSQLKTFWHFESLWKSLSPRTHRAFRCFYNWIGPIIAGLIKTQITADIAYLTLKPFETIANLIIRIYEHKN